MMLKNIVEWRLVSDNDDSDENNGSYKGQTQTMNQRIEYIWVLMSIKKN